MLWIANHEPNPNTLLCLQGLKCGIMVCHHELKCGITVCQLWSNGDRG